MPRSPFRSASLPRAVVAVAALGLLVAGVLFLRVPSPDAVSTEPVTGVTRPAPPEATVATSSPSVTVPSTSSPPAPDGTEPASGHPKSGTGAATRGTGSTVAAGSRTATAWPFARDSIWNTPIGSGAKYVDARLGPALAHRRREVTIDPEHISVNPSFPVKLLNGKIPVHVDPDMEHDGRWNGCATFLRADKPGTVISGQPLVLRKGGHPSWKWTIGESIDLRGDGVKGCHGGSKMSGIGGTIRVGEMKRPEPLRHALKINLNCELYCSFSDGGKRWPALAADAYASPDRYGGKVRAVKMGTLLALPPSTDLSFIESDSAKKIATALRDYGGYVVDDTAWDVHALSVEKGADFSDGGTFHADLMKVFTMLHAVDNNAPGRIGGGGNRRAPLAPCFQGESSCRR